MFYKLLTRDINKRSIHLGLNCWRNIFQLRDIYCRSLKLKKNMYVIYEKKIVMVKINYLLHNKLMTVMFYRNNSNFIKSESLNISCINFNIKKKIQEM